MLLIGTKIKVIFWFRCGIIFKNGSLGRSWTRGRVSKNGLPHSLAHSRY